MNNILIVLKKIKQQLEGSGIRWFVCGSASLLLQGMNVKPNDLDLVIKNSDKDLFMSLFKDFNVINEGFINKEYESLRFFVDNVKVEVCAELPIGKYYKKISSVVLVKGFPCLGLIAQAKAYEESNRPEKARSIKEFLGRTL